ncbi:MAG: hypothetical protein OES57_04465 [Acidimicrobiia bacterium]|nr:hypothetical protein [Acidimicrobiia bacterium]
MPKIDLLTVEQRRRLKLLRVVAGVAFVLVAVGVLAAFMVHWGFGLLALFVAPVVVFGAVVLFETVVPD